MTKPATTELTYPQVLEQARERLAPKCKVCPVCNGKACAGLLPGPGGKGSASTFQRNQSFLAEQVKLHLLAIGASAPRVTDIELFGKRFDLPVFAAPIGMVALNWSDAMNETSYSEAVVEGMKQSGSVAFTGGGGVDECFFAPLEVLKQHGGWGIPTLKPWNMELVAERVALVEQAGVMAIAMDIDTAGLPHAAAAKHPVCGKTQEDLRAIVNMTKLPFLVKGIMTADAAVQAAEAGAYGIVVSNHGGRVLNDGLSSAEVLPEIRRAVGDRVKVLVDGGIRTGVDLFKVLALGADAALIGRPYSIAAYGGGAEGVRLYSAKLKAELVDVMTMTGCYTLKDINADKIRVL